MSIKQVLSKKSFGSKIYLEWVDAWATEGWMSLRQAMKIPDDVYCFTNAWYIGEKDGFVIISHTKGKTKDDDMMGKLLIPKNWIRRVK